MDLTKTEAVSDVFAVLMNGNWSIATRVSASAYGEDTGEQVWSEQGTTAWIGLVGKEDASIALSRRAANSAGGVGVKARSNDQFQVVGDAFLGAIGRPSPAVEAEPVAWQWSDFSGKWYTVDTAHMSLAEQEELARAVAKERGGRVRPCFASSPVSAEVTGYLVWSNEHRAWWRANSQGYARNILEAGRYTRAEAVGIADKSRNGWELDRRPDEIAVAIADLPPPIIAALNGGRENG